MKSLVLIFLTSIVGRQFVSSQFTFPPFNLPQLKPSSFGFQVPSPASFGPQQPSGQRTSEGLSLEKLVENLDQNFTSSGNKPSLRTFEQIFNASQPNFFPTNTIASFAQAFANVFNLTALQNVLSPSGVRQLGASINYDSVPPSIRQTLQNAFANFDNAVNASFVNGLARLESSFENLNQTALSMIAFVGNLTTTSIRDIEANIAQYNQTIQSCINTSVSDYREILPEARDRAINCIHQKMNDGRAIIEEGRNDIIAAVNGARNLTETIQECSDQSNQQHYLFGIVGCYTSAIINIQSETIVLPFQMARRFSEMDEYVASARANAIKCATIFSETIAEESLNVTQTIANCLIERR